MMTQRTMTGISEHNSSTVLKIYLHELHPEFVGPQQLLHLVVVGILKPLDAAALVTLMSAFGGHM